MAVPANEQGDIDGNQPMRARGQGGFTLVELLVVVAIMGILGSVVVYAARNIINRADVDACVLERRTILTAQGVADATEDLNDTYQDFLENPLTPQYFERAGGTDQNPVWGPTARHPGTGCPTSI